jgi:hypothetical protein
MAARDTSLLLDERIQDDGSLERVTLASRDGALLLQVGSATPLLLPDGALERVMARYGKPLAPDVALGGPVLDAGGGPGVRMLRHRARYDVIAKDYVVYTAPGREPVAELAVAVTAALVHLARAGGATGLGE